MEERRAWRKDRPYQFVAKPQQRAVSALSITHIHTPAMALQHDDVLAALMSFQECVCAVSIFAGWILRPIQVELRYSRQKGHNVGRWVS